jgi:hypothetical protein
MKFRSLKVTGKMIALIAVISLAFGSCKKSDVSNVTASNESKAATLSDSSTVAENAYYDVLNNAIVGYSDNSSVMGASLQRGKTTVNSTETNGSGGAGHISCAGYTISDSTPGHYPKTLTLDFGAGCTSIDGIIRTGKLVYNFSGPLFTPGTTVTVSFNQYTVNGYGIQGTYAITNNSTQSGISFTTLVTNGILTCPDATNFHYSHNKTYTQTAGASTPFDISDDVYSITGNSAFSSSDGSSLVLNVTTPLIRNFTCLNITQGVVSFVFNQGISGTIDFGDGTCDNLATLKVGTISRTVFLR